MSSPVNEIALHLLTAEYIGQLAKRCEDSRASREAMYRKLESMGYDVGRRMTERLTRDKDRIVETLDIIKFICRVFWKEVFQKQVDKLQTNHKGMYVLQDSNFQWLRYTCAAAGLDTTQLAVKFVVFPCGLLRGALSAMGIESVVNAEISATMPQCTFTIKVKG